MVIKLYVSCIVHLWLCLLCGMSTLQTGQHKYEIGGRINDDKSGQIVTMNMVAATRGCTRIR